MSDVDSFEKDTHTEHCCSIHGCKYGNHDCTVVMGIKEQSFPCEDCYDDAEKLGIEPEQLRHYPKPRIGYMCKTDFDHELGQAAGGTVIYPSINDLKRSRRCADECGIVKVEIRFLDVEQGPKPISEIISDSAAGFLKRRQSDK